MNVSSRHTRSCVGVVGLGAMGRPIAHHLIRAGVATCCFDLDSALVDDLVASGSSSASSLIDLAARSSVVLIFVPSDEDVLRACNSTDGLLASAPAGATLVVCSSARPDTCQSLAALAAATGVRVIDAALTGGVRGAEAGEVNLLVGGDGHVLDEIRPILEPWTRAIHHLGPLGAGQVGKTVNNLMHWTQISALTEALTLGQRLGVPPSRLRAALMDGPTDSRTLREIEYMRLTWHAKDLANALAMAEGVGQDLPVATRVRDVMKTITVERIAALIYDNRQERS